MRLKVLGSLFYLFYYLATGSLLPYLNLYYQSIGLPAPQIGLLAALLTLAMLVAAPLWGSLADARRVHRPLLFGALLAVLLPAALLSQAQGLVSLALSVLALGVLIAPAMPLADSAVISGLGDERSAYGRLRLWGAVGFAAGAWGTGEIARVAGLPVIFPIYLLLLLPCAIVGGLLPAPAGTLNAPFWRSMGQLLRHPGWLRFLLSVTLFGTVLSLVNNYYSLHLRSLGGDEALIGFAVALSAVSELPIFALSAWLLRRYTPATLIRVAFAVLLLRSLLYATLQSPWLAVLVQLLHGPTFALLWTAGVLYASQIAPAGLGTSAQAWFSTAMFSLGGIAGALPGGYLYQSFGAGGLFLAGACIALAGSYLFTGGRRGKAKRAGPPRHEPAA